jgi:class 3 adenylate cyclase/tetratricopeptide (TPR) repeat protein
VPAEARFCPNCGHTLHQAGDERRVVTVVFADIVGFTTLAESRDPEQVKNVVDRCFVRLAEDIALFGGTVDKVVGDGLMALFGAPVAHEDDAERAVRAALQMQRTVAETARSVGLDLRMRMGVNTGEVVFGSLRAGGDSTVMGDVVNTASRLQTFAEPGQVVIGPDTFAATAGIFRFDSLGPVHARGREAPIPAWVAVEALTEPGRRARHRRSGRFIGRDLEVELLERVLNSSFEHRRPTMIVVVGEAGIGKSRLVEEALLRVVGRHQVRVIGGRGVPYGAANVWEPVSEVIRAACGIEAGEAPDLVRPKVQAAVAAALRSDLESEEVERVVGALAFLVGLSDTQPTTDELGRAVRVFMQGLAAAQPLVVSIGDAHWVDPLVLDGLDRLLRRMQRVPLVVVVTARTALAGWQLTSGQQNVVVLHVDPLDSDASEELLLSLLGHDPGPRARAQMVERAGGNPLFVEELVAMSAERRQIDGLPATLRGIVAARLDAVGPEERTILDDVAVLGRRIRVAVLVSLAGERGAAVPAAVARLVDRELLEEADGWVEFRSDVMREVVYATMTKAERARRHARLAALISERLPSPLDDEAVAERARHWATAAQLTAEVGGVEGVPDDVREQAVDALVEAGHRAEERELHAAAFRAYDQLVGLLGEGPSTDRGAALVGRAKAATALHGEDVDADLDEAERIARDAGDEGLLAGALMIRGDVLRHRRQLDESLAALQTAREIYQRLGNERGVASALRRIGWSLVSAGQYTEAEPLLLEAFEVFRRTGAVRGQAWVLQTLAWTTYGHGAQDISEQRLRESRELFRQVGDWGGLSWSTGMLAWLRYNQGHIAEAETMAHQNLADSRDQGNAWQAAMMLVLLARIRLWEGRIAEAVRLAWDGEQLVDEADRWSEVWALSPRHQALLLAGRFDEAEVARAETIGRREVGSRLDRLKILPLLATVAADLVRGEPAGALEGLAPFVPMPDQSMASISVDCAYGAALVQSGRPEEALALFESVADGLVQPGPRAQALAGLALAQASAGRPELARATVATLRTLGGSYLERALGEVADACAAAALGDAEGARASIDVAARTVEATEDRVTAVVVAVARAEVLAALGDPFAAGAAHDAQVRLATVGMTAEGWITAFRMAVSPTAGATAPA